VRWLALGAGGLLIVAAFLAGARVADTREGLIYEIVTLLAGLGGVSLLLYGLVGAFGRRPAPPATQAVAPAEDRVHNAAELALGAAGLLVAAILLTGVAASGGVLWALLGGILLLPMIAGSAYLCYRFLRAPRREWKIDVRSLMSGR
jgi:hypothetical protein